MCTILIIYLELLFFPHGYISICIATANIVSRARTGQGLLLFTTAVIHVTVCVQCSKPLKLIYHLITPWVHIAYYYRSL